ncbi:MAG: outer rane channel protein [Herminiimonas sp.]|nr:outer rane channel protein [Herminiimonas sp.]
MYCKIKRLCKGAMGIVASLSAATSFALPAPAGQPAAAGSADAKAEVRADAKPAAGSVAAKRSPPTPVCAAEFASGVNVVLPEGKSSMLDLKQMNLPAPAWLRTVGDPEVVQVEPMTSSAPRAMFFLFGKKVGATNLMFQDRDGRCGMVEVSVGVDTGAVQAKLNQLMPLEKNIRISAAADSLVLSGLVSDSIAADKVLQIANAFLRKAGAGAASGAPGGGERIVNMLAIAAPQQVMLEVKVAEISKTLLDRLGVSLSATSHNGSWATSLSANFKSGSSGVLSLVKVTTGEFITLDAEKRDGLIKILAEPNIMAISGQEGSFLAGGKIFIPVAQSGSLGITSVTLEEKEFGVGLRFTPTVLEGGRINIRVAPEVSELSREGVGISSTGIGGNAVLPLFTTRRASTTVQLYDGQSFAIGGLIKNNVTENIKALPILGEIPVLGALFRSAAFQTDLSELVFIVTPRLVKALPPDYALPTDKYVEPKRAEFFLGGKMEGKPPAVPLAPPPSSSPTPSSPSSPSSPTPTPTPSSPSPSTPPKSGTVPPTSYNGITYGSDFEQGVKP